MPNNLDWFKFKLNLLMLNTYALTTNQNKKYKNSFSSETKRRQVLNIKLPLKMV